VGTNHKKDLKEIGRTCERVKNEAVNRLGWKKSMCSFVDPRQLGAPMSY